MSDERDVVIRKLENALHRYHEQINLWVRAGCPAAPLPSIVAAECADAEEALNAALPYLSGNSP